MDCRGLSYLVIETSDRAAWSEFLVEVMGCMPGEAPAGSGGDADHFRLDDRSFRICVQPSSQEGYVAGWGFASEEAWQGALDELSAAGITVVPGDEAEAGSRGVRGLARLEDPFSNRIELVWGQQVAESRFESPQGAKGFRTGESGMGHLLYNVPSSSEALAFYRDLMGFRVTDYFAWGENSACFLRCNDRHHTVAFVDLPLPGGPGLNHFMVEAGTLDDVGYALDRAVDAGVEIVNSLGKHSNDKCVSFYMRTPGRANVEIGVDQLRIDDATWQVIAWSGRGDYWGHRGPLMDEIADAKQ